jgi:broad specificity phosphatase PhoE
MKHSLPRAYLARHGETEWAITGQHTGLTDIPLTPRGERNAVSLGDRIAGKTFARVISSPLVRARRTCELSGYGEHVEIVPDLVEWDYGKFEGIKTVDIRKEWPDWFLFRDGCPGGESVEQVGARADRIVTMIRSIAGDVLVFSHGHFLRVLAARWIGLAPGEAGHFYLGTASLSAVGYEHDNTDPTIILWNDNQHVGD